MTRHRVDANQSEIIKAWRRVGAVVIITTGDPEIGFDALVAFRGRLFVAEIKDGSKPPSDRTLTENEQHRKAMLESVNVVYSVVESVEDAMKLLDQ